MADFVGTPGNDTLNGTSGADTMSGLGGNDIYIVNHPDDVAIEAPGQGTDIIYSAVSYRLNDSSEVENLSTISWQALDPLSLFGNMLANTLIGNAGANQLDGGAGADVMFGREGNDIYIVDNVGDQPVEAAGQGIDIVYSSVSYTLGASTEVENLSTISWQATNAIALTGNALANTLIGNAGANQLDGGAGADVMFGREGNDIYLVDSASDQPIEVAGQGSDAIYSSVSYTLAAGQDIEGLSTLSWDATSTINLTGNAIANHLIGNAGANQLDGGAGSDAMTGFGGDDIYLVDDFSDSVVEAAGGGWDAAYSSVTYDLTEFSEVEGLSTLSWDATTAINLTGNSLNNYLMGNAGANILNGLGGSDTLQGREGGDTFAFTTALGAGNVDLVFDFETGIDKILLGGFAGQPFAALASEALAGFAFRVGAAAVDADDVIVYNSATGQLFYDADGSGAGAAVQFATLSAGLGLTAADFTVSGGANNPPVITSPATASVAENSPASTVVYQAAASDADGDRITYSLGGADASLLTIDEAGAVHLKAAPDFEARATYSFSVIASDSGPNSAVRAVTLSVTNVDEATPIIIEQENNDTSSFPQPISRAGFLVAANPNLPNDDLPSATIAGNISSFADQDWFRIELQAGERIILDVDNSGGNLDSMVRLYSSAHTLAIAENDDLVSLDPGSAPHPEYGHNTDSLVSFRAPTSGTYYFSIEALQDEDNPTFGTYELHVSIGPPATPAELLDEDIDALISGDEWAVKALTYSFPTSINQYPPDIDETSPASDFAPFTAVQQQATTQLLQLAANVSQLTFALAANPASAHLKFAMSSEAESAYAFYPPFGNPTPGSSLAGTAWFNKLDFNSPVKGNYAWAAILHEAGHTLGLKHGHEAPAISPGRDSLEYTVMTYRSYVGGGVGPDDGYSNETWGYPQTLMMLDIAALQRVYGANFSHNSGDTTYRWSPITGELSINGFGQGAPGSNRVFMTLWDGGGVDTYDFTSYTSGSSATIDLRPGEWSRTSAAQIANLGDGNMARGNIANALLYDNDPRSLIENAISGAVGDTLIANQAANRLTGNGGADTFKWMAGSDAGAGALADTITDFNRGTDRIDLASIDTRPETQFEDAFLFIGTDAFHNVRGELRYQVEGGNLRIQGDLDGNGIADMEIIVNNNTILAAADFFL